MRKNIGFLYLYSFFDHFIVAYVIERLFDLEWGQSVQTIVLLGILYGALTIGFSAALLAGLMGGALAEADRFDWHSVCPVPARSHGIGARWLSSLPRRSRCAGNH